MRWAITPNGIGKPVGYRPLGENETTLAGGETFITTTDPADKLLGDDERSLRNPTSAERLRRVKDNRWERIKEKRQRVLYGGVRWNGHRWETSEEDYNRISRTVQSWSRASSLPPDQQAKLPGPVPSTIFWTTADDEEVELTLAQLITLDAVFALHVGTTFGVAKQLRVAIEAATTADQVRAIDWP